MRVHHLTFVPGHLLGITFRLILDRASQPLESLSSALADPLPAHSDDSSLYMHSALAPCHIAILTIPLDQYESCTLHDVIGHKRRDAQHLAAEAQWPGLWNALAPDRVFLWCLPTQGKNAAQDVESDPKRRR